MQNNIKNGKQGRFKATIALLLMFGLSGMVTGCSGKQEQAVDTSQGIQLIQEQEAFPVDEIKNILRSQKEAHMREECEQNIAVLQEDNSKVWSMFDDFLFFGDSRCVAMRYYGFFTENQCYAIEGVNIRTHLEANINEIQYHHPHYLYLAYGVNDISCGFWVTGQEYADEYGKILDEIHLAVPDTIIYVNSILLASGSAFDRYAGFKYAQEWNGYLKEMCERRDYCYYVDNDAICLEHQDLYLDDGIHFTGDFYPIWATNIMITKYQNELEEAIRLEAQNDPVTGGE